MTNTRWYIPALFACCLVPSITVAQHADSLAELSRRVEILTEEIERLKLGAVDASSYDEIGGLGPAASKVYSLKKSGVSLAGYGELVYENYASTRDNGAASSSKDQIDFYRNILYVGFRFSDWILFNSEIEIEHASTGSGGEVSLEFGYIDLLLSKAANVRAGMMLAPVGLINEKHEPPTFFGTVRPNVERYIIPSTWRVNGAGVFGEPVEGLDYRVYLIESLTMTKFSAGSGVRSGRQHGAKAVAEDLAVTGKIEYKGIPGMSVGGSFFAGKTGQGEKDSVGASIAAMTSIIAFHGEYAWKGLEVRGVFARSAVSEAERVGGYLRWKSGAAQAPVIGSAMQGWYLQAGYDVMPFIASASDQYLAPYVMYETYNTQQSVPSGMIADPSNDRSSMIVGLTWKPHPNVAFKADYRDNKNGAKSATDQVNIAVTYIY